MDDEVTVRAGLQDPVERIMSWPVATVDVTAPLVQAAEAMAANDIGLVAVTSGDRLVGVVSERDLVRRMSDEALAGAGVQDVVTYEPLTLSRDDTVVRAAEVMVEAGVRHLPVIDGDEAVGIVSLRDVTAVLLATLI